MTLYMFVFDHMNFPPCTVMVGCVRAKASLPPRVSDDVVIHIVVQGGVLDLIETGITNSWIVLREARQYWFEVVAVYKTQMPHVNGNKNFLLIARSNSRMLIVFIHKLFSSILKGKSELGTIEIAAVSNW